MNRILFDQDKKKLLFDVEVMKKIKNIFVNVYHDDWRIKYTTFCELLRDIDYNFIIDLIKDIIVMKSAQKRHQYLNN